MTTDDTELSSDPSQTDDDRKTRKRERSRAWQEANREKLLEKRRAYRAANLEKAREYDRAWYAANNEKMREKGRVYYAVNRKHMKETNRVWYAANREKQLEYNRAYHAAHREDRAKQMREYQLAHPEAMRLLWVANSHKRRAYKAAVGNTFTRTDWKILVARSKCCHWCKASFSKGRRPTHDHVIPLSRGGGNTLENSVCACSSCNTRKGNRLINPITGQGILL